MQKIIFKPPIISCLFVFFLAFGVHGEVIRRTLREREGGRNGKEEEGGGGCTGRKEEREAYGGVSISPGTRVTSERLVQGPGHGVILLYRKPMMTVFRCWLARFKNTPAGRPPYSLSLCIDDYGNEASLVTLTYTLFACSRSRLCAILYRRFYTADHPIYVEKRFYIVPPY